MTKDNASGAGMELPDAWDYAYEWDSPFGLRRSFDYRPYNGTKPDRHVSLFTEEQLRDYAQAHNAKLEAQVERLRQGLWDVYAALGCDTDGDPTPVALVSDIVELVVNAAKEARRDYDAALKP